MKTSQASLFTDVNRAVDHLETEGYTVDHLSHDHYTVAIRLNHDNALDLTLSNGETTEELRGLSLSQALLLIEVYLFGDRILDNQVDRWINQAVRHCTVVKTTPTRVRLEYQMPNSGLVGGWQYYVDLNGDRIVGWGDVQSVAARIAERAKQVA